MRLTFRVEDDELWACDDEGRSRRLDDARTAELIAWWEDAPSVRPPDGRTAAVLADLGQARFARPHPTGRTVPARVEHNGERIALGRLTTADSLPLAKVLENRHSARSFGSTTLAQVATLVMRSGRVREWTTVEDGYQATHRPTPSAGARHPFDLHLVAGRLVDDLDSGIYIFDAPAGALVRPRGAKVDPAALLNRLGDHLGAPTPPAAAVFLVGYIDRTLSRYPAGMSLAWRDAGALLQTLHLCATDLRLRSCIAGTCGFLYNQAEGPVIDMGCLALGGILR